MEARRSTRWRSRCCRTTAAKARSSLARRTSSAALPAGKKRAFRSLQVASAACGGCGTRITDADIESFRKQMLDDGRFFATLLGKDIDRLGAAFQASGEGRKVAVVVAGISR